VFLSKSFGYALRGILYIASTQQGQHKVQIREIAEKLMVPRHFLGKIMQTVVKKGLLHSTKGPNGGLYLSENTLATPLIKLVEITDGTEQFDICVLQFRNCSKINPCPLHIEMEQIKVAWKELLINTTISDLMSDNRKSFISSLVALPDHSRKAG
jgi:Rrf2 family iron-sulfur cluster assembly transcriptional regulator